MTADREGMFTDMSRFADCFPWSDSDTLQLERGDSCRRCGHRAVLHSEDRACAACEQAHVMASSFDPLLQRVEALEQHQRRLSYGGPVGGYPHGELPAGGD